MRPNAWPFRTYRQHLAERFPGRHVRKLGLDAGFTCPNIDGTITRGGCGYCNNRAFAPAVGLGPLREQWDRGRFWLRRRHRYVNGFIAYFQAFSNTHAPVERLHELYEPLPQALDECLGVSIGTRPDCLSDEAITVCTDLATRAFLTVEIGLQSDRDEVLRRLNRGHDLACFLNAVQRCVDRGFELCVHLMLGLPGEGADAPERMGNLIAGLPIQSVKMHNLHFVHGTPWGRAFAAGLMTEMTCSEYVDRLARFLACLRPDQSVQRIVGDAPAHLLLSSHWCRDKQMVLRELAELIDARVGSDFDRMRDQL